MDTKKIKKILLSSLVALCLVLVAGIFTTKPVYASEKKPCGPVVEYLGFQTVCYDRNHCNQSTAYKHGQYFRYKHLDTCTGFYTIEVVFDRCITVC